MPDDAARTIQDPRSRSRPESALLEGRTECLARDICAQWLTNGDEAYEAMVRLIHDAKRGIRLESYAVKRSDPALRILDALHHAFAITGGDVVAIERLGGPRVSQTPNTGS